LVGRNGRVWKSTGWWVAPSTARDTMNILGAVGVFSARQRFAWRGMSSADYSLSSSLHRRLGVLSTDERSLREAELKCLADARAWGLGSGETEFLDDLEVLADMQHYGVETRLIDVSSNPMTALWFACQTPRLADVSRTGVLLAVNVSSWERYISIGERAAPAEGRAANEVTLERALARNSSFVVEAAHPNARLRAQEGFFLASPVPSARDANGPFQSLSIPHEHGNPEALAKSLTGDRTPGAPRWLPFVAILISPALKKKLLKYLEGTYNRSARTLFPDYAGFREFAAHGGDGGEPGDVASQS